MYVHSELIPGATFSAQGDVELDLLIIKAGIELAAEVNTQIHPQAYIHGSECEVGFDVEKTNNPMDAYFESFFQLEDCTLWVRSTHTHTRTHAHEDDEESEGGVLIECAGACVV
jgi:hypothetical protein